MKLELFLKKHVGSLMVLTMIFALLVQPVSLFFNHFLIPVLMLFIAAGCIKMDTALLLDELKRWKMQLNLLFLGLILIPTLIYYLIVVAAKFIPFVEPSFALGSLLVNGVAVGSSAPALVMAMNGNFERATLNMILSSIVMVVTLPLLLHFVAHDHAKVSLTHMLISLAILIIPPLIVGFSFKRFLPKISRHLEPHIPIFSIVLLMVIVLGAPSGMSALFMKNWGHTLVTLIIAMVSTILVILAGWFLMFKPTWKCRVTHSIIFAFSNIGLSIVIVHNWYRQSPELIFYVSMSILPICVVPMLIKLWVGVVGNKGES